MAQAQQLRVALVSMPLVTVFRPSLQIGLLQALARRRGFEVKALHAYLDFAAKIGPPLYEALCGERSIQLGEWLFSVGAFGPEAPDQDGGKFLKAFRSVLLQILRNTQAEPEALLSIRQRDVPDYLDYLVDATDWKSFDVVGFSCTFQQTTASFALASRIKQKHPAIITLFGGANFGLDTAPEMLRACPHANYAIFGEGDITFTEFLGAVARGSDPCDLPGVVAIRDGAATTVAIREPIRDLDQLPVPDYTDFFERHDRLRILPCDAKRVTDIPFESSRGCWWGAMKGACIFCGLNSVSLEYRRKGADSVAQMLAELTRRHGVFRFVAVDNIIDPAETTKLFAKLAEQGIDYQLFFEVRSHLTRSQVRRMRIGGVRRVQPGIESLNSTLLSLLGKGVTAIHSINTLRWLRYYGITADWNLLHRIPRAASSDYSEEVSLMHKLQHLQPPRAVVPIVLDRYSQMFRNPSTFGIRTIRPHTSYYLVYPKRVQVESLCHNWEYELDHAGPDSMSDSLELQVLEWQRAWSCAPKPSLLYWHSPGRLLIEDRRSSATRHRMEYVGVLADLYRMCSNYPASVMQLATALGISGGALDAMLGQFCGENLMIRERSLCLSLALPATPFR